MARIINQPKRGFIMTLDKNLIKSDHIVSVIRTRDLLIFLNKKGDIISYAKLDPEKEGKSPEDADQCTDKLLEASKANPFFDFGDGNYIRCSAIEAIENIKSVNNKGLIIRGEHDGILAFIPIPNSENRSLVVSKLHAAMESFEKGKFEQPDLAGIF